MNAAAEWVGRLPELMDEHTRGLLERRDPSSRAGHRGWLVRRLLVSADVAGLLAAMLLTEWLVAGGVSGSLVEAAGLVATLPAWVVVANLYGLYSRDEERTDHSTADDISGVFHMVTVCTWTLWAVSRSTGVVHPTSAKLLVFWIGAIAFVSSGRVAARAIAHHSPAYLQNAVVVGAGDVAQLVARKLTSHREYGVNLVGFVDDTVAVGTRVGSLPLLGSIGQLPELVT